MKLVFALLFLCVTYSSIAQNKSPEVYSPESTQFIDDLEAYLTSIHTETETMDITSEFWDTSKIKIDYGRFLHVRWS